MCAKTLHSRDSNWIINAEGKYFCDNLEIEDSCFDKYINKRKKNEKKRLVIIQRKMDRKRKKVCTIILIKENKLVHQEVNLNLL
jgi:translation initiation factor 1 (eIF-1/SUI1)